MPRKRESHLGAALGEKLRTHCKSQVDALARIKAVARASVTADGRIITPKEIDLDSLKNKIPTPLLSEVGAGGLKQLD